MTFISAKISLSIALNLATLSPFLLSSLKRNISLKGERWNHQTSPSLSPLFNSRAPTNDANFSQKERREREREEREKQRHFSTTNLSFGTAKCLSFLFQMEQRMGNKKRRRRRNGECRGGKKRMKRYLFGNLEKKSVWGIPKKKKNKKRGILFFFFGGFPEFLGRISLGIFGEFVANSLYFFSI